MYDNRVVDRRPSGEDLFRAVAAFLGQTVLSVLVVVVVVGCRKAGIRRPPPPMPHRYRNILAARRLEYLQACWPILADAAGGPRKESSAGGTRCRSSFVRSAHGGRDAMMLARGGVALVG